MKINWKAGAAASAAYMLAACASTTMPDYDPVLPLHSPLNTGTQLNLILQLPENPTAVDMPVDLSSANDTAMNMVNTGQASPAAGAAGGIIAGLLIAAIDAGVDANRNGNFREMLEAHDVHVETEFNSALEAAFSDRTLNVSRPDYTREKKELQAPSALKDLGTDLVLDIVIHQYGYNMSLPYYGWAPSFTAELRLTEPSTGTILMDETIVSGSPGMMPISGEIKAGNAAIILPFDPAHTFKSVNAFIKDDPERAVEGLRFTLTHAAEAIADLLLPLPSGQAVTDVTPSPSAP